ncbi:MAG TPA: hypothetical protein VL991_07845 [Terracidiphilus sp.]|nr:hypothetical protein [Terracidiphilus sp.]
MKDSGLRIAPNYLGLALLLLLSLAASPLSAAAQTQPSPPANTPAVPDWALPGSPTHKQYPPPADFHRPSTNFDTPIGIFDGQSDIGSALVPGSASFDPQTKQYTVNSAGYNIWYTRDEFRYLWKKMSGDVSLAATVTFPVAQQPPHDRKVVLVVRQDLDDNAKEIMAAEHGTGMVHLAERPEKNSMIGDMEYRISGSLLPNVMPQRIGIEKLGDSFALYISVRGEPMHQFGPPMEVHMDGPFYVGIGFCSHYPVTVDTGMFSDVVLENAAGEVR